ncbi:hypothetical protein [Kitasatospora sp. NPDC058218]|uniref:hypothetical protein n=1 Tax=Kitasatospora sp. NPDC058218 TaxID=3346385 RepID=UPI0036D97EC0
MSELIECRRRIDDFTVGMYLEYVFPGDSCLVPGVLLGDDSGAPEVTLLHSFRLVTQQDAEASELNFRLSIRIAEPGCSVEGSVEVDLEQDMGEFDTGVTVLQRARREGLTVEQAVELLRTFTDAMVEMGDVPERLGLVPRR